ncbi:MAG: 4a-hydroxytetrahydrobiopterin dehydratase [Crocinitomicaceae bacterium]|nr:4a-hydroxytetrahydrobiopterin dehydratase [Crocinitomicaceae bacterium]
MFTQSECIPCQGGIPPLKAYEIETFLKLIDNNWSVIDNKELVRNFKFDNYKSAIKFTNSVAELAENEGHHPYIHVNYKIVKIILFTHKIEGLHENDFLLASKIDKL